jgi:hypothetical protein
MASPILEVTILVTTDAAHLTPAQHNDLVDRLAHWMPATQVLGDVLTIEMVWWLHGDSDQAATRARKVVKQVFQDMGVAGSVLYADALPTI